MIMIILCCPVHDKVRGSDYGVFVQIINNRGFGQGPGLPEFL